MHILMLAREEPLVGGRLEELEQHLQGRLNDLEIMDSPRQRQEFSEIRRKFIDSVIENLKERFPHMDLLGAFSILDPSHQPGEITGDYGWEEIRKLSNFYCDGPKPIDPHDLRDEWISFRQQLPSYRKKSPKEMCQLLTARPTLSCQYPNIQKLYNRMVVIPAHTADCERAFSCLKRVKTRLRSSLTAAHLNNLLTVRMEGPEIQAFNFDEAVSRWGELRNRRILI